MRHSIVIIAAGLLLGACSGKSSSTDGGSGPQLVDGVKLSVDRTQLLFGQDYGNATLLGTQPADTLQLISGGKQALTISKVEIVAGTAPDGGPSTDINSFSFTGPDQTTLQGGQTGFVQVVFKPDQAKPYSAILRITSNDPGSPTDVWLSGDCVTPVATVLSNNVTPQLEVGTASLVPHTDGGTDYATQFLSADVWFANAGTAQLIFQDAQMAGDAGTSPFQLCTNTIQGGTVCQPGPLPSSLERVYPDGGLAIRAYGDGGYAGAARLRVVYTANTPGDFTDHVIVPSNDQSSPLVFTVHGSATAP